jgi:hypothetical protein
MQHRRSFPLQVLATRPGTKPQLRALHCNLPARGQLNQVGTYRLVFAGRTFFAATVCGAILKKIAAQSAFYQKITYIANTN